MALIRDAGKVPTHVQGVVSPFGNSASRAHVALQHRRFHDAPAHGGTRLLLTLPFTGLISIGALFWMTLAFY